MKAIAVVFALSIVVSPAGPTPEAYDPPPRDAGDDQAGAPYGLEFRCPPVVWSRVEEQAVVHDETCPVRLLDPEDIMGQPVLVVDPMNPNVMAFSALHGGRGLHPPAVVGGVQPPTERSRSNALHQPHTVWQTDSAGASWSDNRYYAPPSLQRDNRILFGEDNAIALDPQGNIYVASLYSYRDQGASSFHFPIALWKAQRGPRAINYHESYSIVPTWHSTDDAVRDSLYLSWSESGHMVAVWREGPQASGDEDPAAGWIRAARTKPGGGSSWELLPETEGVGPCRAVSNPVVAHGLMYVGCRPAAAYRANGTTDLEYWQVHTIDTGAWRSSYVGPTPLRTSHLHLTTRGTPGYMIAIGSGVDASRQPVVETSLGVIGRSWEGVERWTADLRTSLTSEQRAAKVADARVTAAAATAGTGYLHLIYRERYDVDQDRPTEQSTRTFYKTYAVLRPNAGFQGNFDAQIDYGDPAGRAQFALAYQGGLNEGIFDDAHDTIRIWKDPENGRERIWVALGDYGSVRFAEVVEVNPLPAFPLPPILSPPVPVLLQTGTSALQGAAAGVIVLLMALRLLARKRKVPKAVEA